MTALDLDVDSLLTPFGDEQPCGADPREDASAQSFYYRLRDARAEARDAERRVDGGGEDSGTPPQWRVVRDLATRLLRERAKDLEVAAWLTEALVREAGFKGLTKGAELIRGLAVAFWDAGLFPTPDEDGLATLVAPVAGLSGASADGTLAQPLRKQVMFVRSDKSEFTFWQYALAVEVEGIGEAARKQARIAAGAPAFAAVDKDARAASPKDFAELRDELDEAARAWNAMSAALDERAGSSAPSTGKVRDLLADLLAKIAVYAPARVEAALPAEPAEAPTDAADPNAPAGATPAARPVARPVTREDMLADLARIAEHFRRTEPQSPLSLTLEEAIRRARLSWPELLEEVVADTAARNTMLTQLGIRPKPPESS